MPSASGETQDTETGGGKGITERNYSLPVLAVLSLVMSVWVSCFSRFGERDTVSELQLMLILMLILKLMRAGDKKERKRENPASTEREREREKERKREETKGRQETTEKRVLSRLMPRFKSVPLDVSFLYFLSFGREVIIVFLCLCETLLISLFLWLQGMTLCFESWVEKALMQENYSRMRRSR